MALNKKALIAMSGGVDSSVAAYLIQQAGYSCAGANMRLFTNADIAADDKADDDDNSCCSAADAEDARQVAARLGMPFYVFNMADKFRAAVIDRFIAAYQAGETPNPCIDCNRYLKFEGLFEKALTLGYDYIVTGHYARILHDEQTGRWQLLRATDPAKDQSYVLYSLTQEQLAHTLFPLGELAKQQVRQIATEQGFVTAQKAESQDICFVPDGDYAAFIEQHSGQIATPGDFIDVNGKVLGRHRGVIRYTVGQRRGLGLAMPRPVYVKEIDPAANTVTVAYDEELFCDRLVARNINLIDRERIDKPLRLQVKIRYNQKAQWATVAQTADDELSIVFDEPQRAIAKGQAAVLYDGDVVVGGGRII